MDVVEVLKPDKHKGKRGQLKDTQIDENGKAQFKVRLGFKEIWVDEIAGGEAVIAAAKARAAEAEAAAAPAAAAGASPADAASTEEEEFREGVRVEVTSGADAGRVGTILKVVGEGDGRRYRVQWDGMDSSAWVTAVEKVSGDAAQGGLSRADFRKQQQEALIAHYAALKSADVNTIDWEKAKGFRMLDGGSGGALLIDLDGVESVVLKPQMQTAVNEFLTQHIANCVGVRVAQLKPVRDGTPEHKAIEETGIRLVRWGEDDLAYRIFGKRKNPSNGEIRGRSRQVHGVLEYVSGRAMMGVEAQQLMTSPPAAVYHDLGRICALDVLLNNLDRVPLPVWSNEGNMGNVMIAEGGTRTIGIDQQVNIIKSGAYRGQYHEKVKNLIAGLLPGGDKTEVVDKLKQVMVLNLGLDLSEQAADGILAGMLEGFAAISAAWTDGRLKRTLEDALVTAEKIFKDDSYNYSISLWNAEEVAEFPGFVYGIAEVIAATCPAK